MKRVVTINPNPSTQQRDRKVKEVSFINSKGEYTGCLISFAFAGDDPVINIYRIDAGIKVFVAEERE